MLYLIEQDNYMKIGYCKDGGLKNRMANYRTDNINFRLVGYADGTRIDEKILHHRLEKYRYQGEWFSNRAAVVRVFLDYDKGVYIYPDSLKDPVIFRQCIIKPELDMIEEFGKRVDIFCKVSDILIDRISAKVVRDALLPEFRNSNNFQKLLKLYCNYRDHNPDLESEIEGSDFIPTKYHRYYNEIGSARLKSLEYTEKYILNEYAVYDSANIVRSGIYREFKKGMRLTRESIKEKMQKIYDSININKKAKASDINDYFNTKRIKKLDDNKYKEGFELISMK